MLDIIKYIVNLLHEPTIAFTLLTVGFPFVFPPTDWFEKKHRQLRIDKLWSNTGGVVLMLLVVAYFVLAYQMLAYHFFRKRVCGDFSQGL